MSGLCALLRLDGGPPEGIAAMAARLERRGPEGTRLWTDGPAALGHTLLATTPEALSEALPLTDPATGCTVTADARLDNREELIAALGLSGPHVPGDGELILRAWIAWGEAAPGRLLGDFAFAIWDPRSRSLFAARDHLGMRQLAYAHRPGRLLALATEPGAVLEAEGVPRDLDEGRIADVLDGDLETLDATSTFYRAVRRLPPAHLLTAGPQGLAIRRYWTLEPGPELRLPSDEAYAEALREVFTESVRARLRSAGPVGSMLSGGMDSGSTVAVASRLLAESGRGPLATFSALGPDPATCVETRAIRASLSMPNLDPHLALWSDPDPWREDLVAPLLALDEPFDGHMNLPRLAYLLARRAGVKVVLDGVAGDVVLHRPNAEAWLLRQGRWRAAWREAKGTAAFHGLSAPGWLLLGSAASATVPSPLKRLRWLRRVRRHDRTGWASSLPGLAERADLPARRHAYAQGHIRSGRSPRAEQAADIAATSLLAGRERYDRVAAGFGIEPRDPFLDLRVVRLAVSLPLDQLQSGGWPKMILRRAMQGLLPDEVRWRKGKEGLGWRVTESLFESHALSGETGLRSALAGAADLPATAIPPEDRLFLGLWLQEQANRLRFDPEALVAAWRAS